jgi:hypothetical protein
MGRFQVWRARVREWWSIPPHAATVAFLALVLVGTIGFLRVEEVARDTDAASYGNDIRIRNSQVTACQTSLAPGGVRFQLAKVHRQQIEDEQENIEDERDAIAQAKLLALPRFFPQVGAAELQRLTRSRIRQRRENIAESRMEIEDQKSDIRAVLDVDCPALYPEPKG